MGPTTNCVAIDRLNIHSAEVAHCTHTTEPMASSSHSGGPTAFRRNQPTAMTLSQPLRPNPQRAGPGWPRVYQRHTDHRRGQNFPHGDRYQKSQIGIHKVLPTYRARVSTPITFPSGRHRREVTTIARIKASQKANVAAVKKFSLAALWLDPIDDGGGLLLLSHFSSFSIIMNIFNMSATCRIQMHEQNIELLKCTTIT